MNYKLTTKAGRRRFVHLWRDGDIDTPETLKEAYTQVFAGPPTVAMTCEEMTQHIQRWIQELPAEDKKAFASTPAVYTLDIEAKDVESVKGRIKIAGLWRTGKITTSNQRCLVLKLIGDKGYTKSKAQDQHRAIAEWVQEQEKNHFGSSITKEGKPNNRGITSSSHGLPVTEESLRKETPKMAKKAATKKVAGKATSTKTVTKKADKAKTTAGRTTYTGCYLLKPNKPRSVRQGTKISGLIDVLSRKNGATIEEISDTLSATGAAVKPNNVKNWLGFDLNTQAGYGVESKMVGTVERFFIVLPKGMKAPLPHIEKKTAAKKEAAEKHGKKTAKKTK